MTAGTARPISSSISWDPEQHRQYTSIYEVITDDVNDGPLTVVNASGVPAYRSTYTWGNDSDPWCFCNSITASIRDVKETRRLWTLTLVHSTRPATRCADTKIEDPLMEPLRVRGSFSQFSKPAEKDRNSKAIRNSVDEPFVPAIEIDDSRKILYIQRNTRVISLSQWCDFSDSVNSNAMWGLDARCIKLNQWDWEVLYYGTCDWYVSHQWEFHMQYDKEKAEYSKWNHRPLDVGFRYLDGGTAPDYKTIPDRIDYPRHQPTPLDGHGEIVDLASGGVPFFHDFEIYKERNFGLLGLPDPLPGPFV